MIYLRCNVRIYDLYTQLTYMENSITLYDIKSPDIHVNIEARFDKGDLIIDGYDIGKTVKEAWGDSDYEYILTIRKPEVARVFEALNISFGEQVMLLQALAGRFNDNYCFSNIEKFLTENGIKHERFTWT